MERRPNQKRKKRKNSLNLTTHVMNVEKRDTMLMIASKDSLGSEKETLKRCYIFLNFFIVFHDKFHRVKNHQVEPLQLMMNISTMKMALSQNLRDRGTVREAPSVQSRSKLKENPKIFKIFAASGKFNSVYYDILSYLRSILLIIANKKTSLGFIEM